jgi:prolyl-tRNA editing enzyme YbaK/EbsC (Cys-tRNA(Pro) deacylase)
MRLFHVLLPAATSSAFTFTTLIQVDCASKLPKLLMSVEHSNDATAPSLVSPKQINFDELIFGEDETLDASRRMKFERLKTVVDSLAEFEGSERVKLIRLEDLVDDDSMKPVNSLLFQVTSRPDPILVILSSVNKVNIKKLEAHLELGNDDERISVSLLPSEDVEQACGFPPKAVPPLGHVPRNLTTLIDSALLKEGSILVGGGGHPDVTCLIAAETLLKLENTQVADISNGSSKSLCIDASRVGSVFVNSQAFEYPKPFFPIAPPDMQTAIAILNQLSNETALLSPQPLTIVARINGVRRMARRLVFCDLAPPEYVGTGTKEDAYELPWRSAVDGQDMAVQLIAGKTFCKRKGDEEGPEGLKRLRVGQLLLIQGKTNIGNRESVGHWIEKRSLDIVLFDYQILQHAQERIFPSPPVVRRESSLSSTTSRAELRRSQLLASIPSSLIESTPSTGDFLKLSDIFSGTETVRVVDSQVTVREFSQALTSLVSSSPDGENGETTSPFLVGVDCEWKPSFLLNSVVEYQPVLLLQVSLQSLEKVFLVDLQTLLRPCLPPWEPMNELEALTSEALSQLFSGRRFLKVGFHLTADLRRLAASYPHMDAFRLFHGVIELQSVARRAMQLAKIRNSRQLSTSLARLAQYFVEKPIDKEQQISDWSKRPLSVAQIEYASLDAAVAPLLFDKSLQLMGTDWQTGEVRRMDDDTSFSKTIVSVRFMFLENDDPVSVRKLKAKKIVTDLYVVTQSWAMGAEEPRLPSLPLYGDEGPYTDVTGILRVPSVMVHLAKHRSTSSIKELVGKRLGKSKDSCLDALLLGNDDLPEGAKLEYHQRSGYVEFADGVALFVNMPVRHGESPQRGYPNAWLDEGRYMTWFLRENEWNHGASLLAKKLLGHTEAGTTVLFVRMGRGDFLCCGCCAVTQREESEKAEEDVKDWGLVELCLELLDWRSLQRSPLFTSMTSLSTQEPDASSIDVLVEISAAELARMVLQGDVVGALSAALTETPEMDRSIARGIEQLRTIFVSGEGDLQCQKALLRLNNVETYMDYWKIT